VLYFREKTEEVKTELVHDMFLVGREYCRLLLHHARNERYPKVDACPLSKDYRDVVDRRSGFDWREETIAKGEGVGGSNCLGVPC